MQLCQVSPAAAERAGAQCGPREQGEGAMCGHSVAASDLYKNGMGREKKEKNQEIKNPDLIDSCVSLIITEFQKAILLSAVCPQPHFFSTTLSCCPRLPTSFLVQET